MPKVFGAVCGGKSYTIWVLCELFTGHAKGKKMKLEEYLKYFNFIQGVETYKIMDGESMNEISMLRVKAQVCFARINHEIAKSDRFLRYEFMKIKSAGKISIDEAKKLAEESYDRENECSVEDLKTLLESVSQFMNACSGRQRALEAEFRGTQRGEL